MSDVVGLTEAARRFNISERQVRRMIAAGQIGGQRVLVDGRWRWLVELDAAASPIGGLPDTPIAPSAQPAPIGSEILAALARLEERLGAIEQAQHGRDGRLAETVEAMRGAIADQHTDMARREEQIAAKLDALLALPIEAPAPERPRGWRGWIRAILVWG